MTVLMLTLAALAGGSLLQVEFQGELQGEFQGGLQGEAVRWAQAWTGKDSHALAGFMAGEGIRLHLPGEEHLSIRPRQAEAALRVFLRSYEAGEASITRVSPIGGGAREGFAEIRWVTGSPGSREPVIFTLFVGYALGDEGWAVTEIRILD